MQRRTRNNICIWVIIVGLVNLLAYTLVYAQLGGDARNGGKKSLLDQDGEIIKQTFYIRGHFLHGPGGQETAVPKWVWIYSYLHSISLWPTQGIMMICMLILAQPHIIATMSESNWIRGPAFIAVAITLVAVVFTASSVWFTIGFITDLLS
ncbi:MAG: hypothetical protein JSV03_14875 [Planctomycetota bacterium]|nr:MAG: hypothetical protein JSV03_14875 [Planctomycetota bacterium]